MKLLPPARARSGRHIVLREAGAKFDLEQVTEKDKKGDDSGRSATQRARFRCSSSTTGK